MFGDMGKMLQQVNEMKRKMNVVEKELKDMCLKRASKDGSVEVEINGKMKLKSIVIKETAPTDRKALAKVVFEAVDAALTDVSDIAQKKLADVTGGIKIPGIN